jgi:hypothetical protein
MHPPIPSVQDSHIANVERSSSGPTPADTRSRPAGRISTTGWTSRPDNRVGPSRSPRQATTDTAAATIATETLPGNPPASDDSGGPTARRNILASSPAGDHGAAPLRDISIGPHPPRLYRRINDPRQFADTTPTARIGELPQVSTARYSDMHWCGPSVRWSMRCRRSQCPCNAGAWRRTSRTGPRRAAPTFSADQWSDVFLGQAAVVRPGVLLELSELEVAVEDLVDGGVGPRLAPLVDLGRQPPHGFLRLGVSSRLKRR